MSTFRQDRAQGSTVPVKVPWKHTIYRYALAPAFLGLALVLSFLLNSLLPGAETYLFLAAVVAAWFGRRSVGLFAAIVAPFVLDCFFLPPLHTLGISSAARPYLVPFLLTALAAAWMGSMHAAVGEAKAARVQDEKNF